MIAVVSTSALLDARISSQITRQTAAETNPIRINVSNTKPKISPPLTPQCYLSSVVSSCLDYASCL